MFRFLALIAFMMYFSIRLLGSHVIGGSIHYEYTSGDSCEITLTLYRDCSSNTEYDDPASIGCFNSSGDLVYNLEIDLSDAIINDVETESSNACYMAPLGLCVQEAFFTGYAVLPPIQGGYTLTYQRCCRNFSIVNIPTGTDVGISLTTQIPGIEVVDFNSNPEFATHPPLIICLNAPFLFDHAATDADGDQLIYEFCDPLNHNGDGPYINPPGAPPYDALPFNAGYSAGYPIDASPAFAIDPSTGLITGTPTSLGQYVIGVCINEYRNGVLINTTNRDFQLNVTNCASVDSPAIADQVNVCSGLEVTFENGSVEDLTYHWDFGVTDSDADTSNLFEPVFTYSAPGTYNIMLILNPGLPCADTTYAEYVSSPALIPFIADFEYSCQQNQLLFDFFGNGGISGSAEYLWTFGANATPSSSHDQNPTNILLGEAGNEVEVQLQVSEFGCEESIFQTITIPSDVVASIQPQTTFCDGFMYEFQNNSENATSYLWDFGVNGSTDISFDESPIYTYADTGYYEVTLVATALNLCPDTASIGMLIYGLLQPDFETPEAQCAMDNLFSFHGSGASTEDAHYSWDFGANANQQFSYIQNPQSITFNVSGIHTVSLTISENDCLETYTSEVEILEDVVAEIETQDVFCTGLTFEFQNLSENATDYTWSFGDLIDGAYSNEMNPVHTYGDSGIFVVQLIARLEDYCADTTYTQVEVFEDIDANFDAVSSQCLSDNSFSFSAEGNYSEGATVQWLFGTSASPTSAFGPSISNVHFDTAGLHEVVLSIEDHGCMDTFTSLAEVMLEPVFSAISDTLVECDYATAHFQGTTIYNTPVQYVWDFGDGANALGESVSHQYTTPGIYDVSVEISSSQGCIANETITFDEVIIIDPSPIAGFLISNQNLSLLNPEASITSVAENAIECSYQISDGGYSNEFDFIHLFLEPGYTEITQYVVSEHGCKSHITGEVIVEGFAFYAPNAFTPDNDGTNDVWLPQVIGVSNYELNIFDRWGELVFQTKVTEIPWTGSVHNGDYFAQDGTYNYTAVLEDILGLPHEFKGHIILTR